MKTRLIIILSLLALFNASAILAQANIGGPYQPDSATVLLMHFDGNLNNESTLSADGIGHGSLYYIPNNVPGLGQCLRIDNDSQSDSSFVMVPDTAALDMTGDWTIEGWINVFTFGEGSSDWRWVPRLCIKTGDEVFWRPNYFVEMWGNNRMFSCGYHTADQSAWPQVNTPNNTMEPGRWFHLTFIRDTSRHILVQVVHNDKRELIVFAVKDYNSFEAPPDTPPITTNQPLYIGFAGGGNDSFLDGFVDEIRISNVVRQIPIPPAITDVKIMDNQIASVTSYPIGADIATLFGTKVTKATLHYQIKNTWYELPMTEVAKDTFSAAIPGQPVGTVIKYYLSAEDEFGMRSLDPQTAESATPEYYTFGVYQPNSMTLELTFEEGQGIPKDASSYNHEVKLFGNPTFSTDTKNGNYAIALEGDSSYLEIDSPFLHSRQFTVELWFSADTMIQYTRLMNRPIDEANWYQNTYEIRFQPNQKISAGSWIPTGNRYTVNDLQVDYTLELKKWYHVIFEVTDSTSILQLRDENDQFLGQKATKIQNPVVQATAPLRIGYAAGRPHYKGRLDNIKIYNYAAANLQSAVAAQDRNLTPRQVVLHQNYPNPFNPTTEIRFSISQPVRTQLLIYDVLGQKVKTLVDAPFQPGTYSVKWDGTNDIGQAVASGVYFYKLHSGDQARVQKMLLIR